MALQSSKILFVLHALISYQIGKFVEQKRKKETQKKTLSEARFLMEDTLTKKTFQIVVIIDGYATGTHLRRL